MRRALALLLLLLATPAHARVAIIVNSGTSFAGTAVSRQEQLTMVTSMLSNGATFDIWNTKNVKTEWARTGVFATSGWGTSSVKTISYDLVVHVPVDLTNAPSGVLRPDSLQYAARWPSVPQVFIAEANNPGFLDPDITDTLSGNSTGAILTAINAPVFYQVGYPERFRFIWSSNNGMPRDGGITALGHVQMPAGIFRVIVGMSSRNPNAADKDGITQQAAPDTMALWARYRSATEKAPLIYVQPGSGTGGDGIASLYAMAFQMADSATGGKVWEDRSKLPLDIALVVRNAFSRGHYNGYSSSQGGGTYCYADSCDSVGVKKGIDSLATLQVPISVGVNLDSVSTYASEKGWWWRLGTKYVKYFPQRNATDSWGQTVTRPPWDPALNALPCACTSSDIGLYCRLVADFASTDSIFGRGFTDHGIAPYKADWIPSQYSRSRIPMDSLAVAMYAAGVRAIVTESDFRSAMPNESYNFSTGVDIGAGSPSANPLADTPVAGWIEVHAPVGSSGVTGRIARLATRGWLTDAGYDFNLAHDYHAEFLWGRLCGRWYIGRSRLGGGVSANDGRGAWYYHYFETPTEVYQIPAGSLGGDVVGAATAGRSGWYQMKWLVHEARIINRLGLPGKPLLRFVHLEDCRP